MIKLINGIYDRISSAIVCVVIQMGVFNTFWKYQTIYSSYYKWFSMVNKSTAFKTNDSFVFFANNYTVM